MVSVFVLFILTPCSRVLLEKPTGWQPVKKFPTFYRIRTFITAFTTARHLSLSWASSIHFITPHPTSLRPILILSSHLSLGLPSGLFPAGFPYTRIRLYSPISATCPAHLILDFITKTELGEQYSVMSTHNKTVCKFYSSPNIPHAPTHLILFNYTWTSDEVRKSWSSSVRSFLQSHLPSSLSDPSIFLSIILRTSLNVRNQVSHPYRDADKSLALPTSRCILFDGQHISFDASLVIHINSTNIPRIMIINRIYEHQNLLSL